LDLFFGEGGRGGFRGGKGGGVEKPLFLSMVFKILGVFIGFFFFGGPQIKKRFSFF